MKRSKLGSQIHRELVNEMRRGVTPSRNKDYHKWIDAPCKVKATGREGKVVSIESPWVYVRFNGGAVERFNRDEITLFRTDAYSKRRRNS